MPYNFGPASPDEGIVFGACRPLHPLITPGSVDDWIEFMKDRGIRRVCCLLGSELAEYDDLLGTYSESFGDSNVVHVPVEDYTVIDTEIYHSRILPFLEQSDCQSYPVVVHCSAGSGRTGQVLSLWLASARGYSIEDAIQTVRETGRDPLEAATISDLSAIVSEY